MIDRLIELEGSTTLFLQDLRGQCLRVGFESQDEMESSGECVIIRAVRLYFDSFEAPLLYCKSALAKENLTEQEYKLLTETDLPIGILFPRLNGPELIKKRNILIGEAVDPCLAISLNVNSTLVFEKKYEYWIGNRKVGIISEFFNSESLSRI